MYTIPVPGEMEQGASPPPPPQKKLVGEGRDQAPLKMVAMQKNYITFLVGKEIKQYDN